MRMALDIIAMWIVNRDPHYVCVTPAHAIMDYRRDEELLAIANNSGLTTPDGMSIVWTLRLMGHKNVERVCGSDLMHQLCAFSQATGWRHYFYGGFPGVAERLVDVLRRSYPGIRIAGCFSPPFRPLLPEEDEHIVNRINDASPDIVWVGIGSPKQERWMAEHIGRVSASALIGVGAAFDFVSGRKKRAPTWMQRAGLEWLHRLSKEPRRLWRRYAQYPLFGLMVAGQLLRMRKQRH
jgi:N-acetylglucosaminyldiphosphoundecaprenol N-acetyl-beta-D-mannosaminyltransferase